MSFAKKSNKTSVYPGKVYDLAVADALRHVGRERELDDIEIATLPIMKPFIRVSPTVLKRLKEVL